MNKIQEACYTEIINEKVYEDTGTMATWQFFVQRQEQKTNP